MLCAPSAFLTEPVMSKASALSPTELESLDRFWIRFTTLKMEAIDDEHAARYDQLPADWHTAAQFA